MVPGLDGKVRWFANTLAGIDLRPIRGTIILLLFEGLLEGKMAATKLHFLTTGVLLVHGDVLIVVQGRKLALLLGLASSEFVLGGWLEFGPLRSEVPKHELLLFAFHLKSFVRLPFAQRMVVADEVHGVVGALSLRPICGLLWLRFLQRNELRRLGDPRLLVIIVNGAHEARLSVIGGLAIDVHQGSRSIAFRAIETKSVWIL